MAAKLTPDRRFRGRRGARTPPPKERSARQTPEEMRELFADLPEEKLRQWLPSASVQQYIRDGTPTTEDDDPWHIAWFDAEGKRVGPEAVDPKENTPKYDRPLRDYALLFSELARERVERITEAKAFETILFSA